MPGTVAFRTVALGLLLVLAALPGVGSAFGGASSEEPPENRRPPQITGLAQVGQVLQSSRGSWRRDRTAVLSYQWRICDEVGATCTDILGATDGIYPIRPKDAGRRLLVNVTAAVTAGESTVASAPTRVVREARAGSPVVTAPPTIGGKAAAGATLTADAGEWQGAASVRFAYQWRRCAADGGACENIARQTAQTYALSGRDVDHTLRVLVRAKNSIGTGAALSDPTPEIAGPGGVGMKPRSTSPPVISGVASAGSVLSVSSGTWSGTTPMTFRFQWLRCAKDGDDCTRIARATLQTYRLDAADVGRAVRARVTASNAAGSSTATSDRSPVVAGLLAPINTAPPTISGTAREGSVLTATPGAWRGDQPIRFSYQWLRCNTTGAACVAIARAGGKSRRVTSEDVGRTLRARLTATNRAGAASAVSNPSALVASKGTAPANRAAPRLSGTPQQGQRLTLTNGTWVGTEPIAYSYAWQRCGASLGDCGTIAGATGNVYVLGRADVGHRLYGVVTARNSAGVASATSNATTVVIGAPFNTSPPTIAGSPIEGNVLTASPGGWAGIQPITFGYQWTRCDASGVFATCTPIVVTSRPTYTLRTADVGHRVFVQVKALNRFGASYVNSAQTQVIGAAPIGTVTIRSSRAVVAYGRSVTLTGRAVGAPAGLPVTVVEQPVVGKAVTHARAAFTTAAGTWTWATKPSLRTTYRAVVRERTSVAVTVLVAPRLELAKKGGTSSLTLRVYSSRSYASRSATLQRWDRKKQRWTRVQRIKLRSSRTGHAPAVITSATLRPRVRRGTIVRILLPSRQTGVGYLAGTSNRVRI